MKEDILTRFLLASCLLFGACSSVQAQCTSSTAFVSANNIVRAAGTDVWTYAQTYVTGSYYDYWLPEVTTTMRVNGQVYSGRSDVRATAGYGGNATNQWHDDPRAAGFGAYATSNTHRVEPDADFCPYDSPSAFSTSNSATVVKPTVDTLGMPGTWWLGGGSDPQNGFYNAVLLVYSDSSSPLPPGTPYWQIIDNADQATLSCTSCTSVNLYSARSTAADGPCDQNYVKVTVSIGGLSSDAANLVINTPRDLVSVPPPDYYAWGGTDGYETDIYYQTRDRCGYALQSIAINEQFPAGWQNAIPNNWLKPSAGGSRGYAGQTYNGVPYVWFDRAKFTVAACQSQPCNPVPTTYQGGNTLVDSALQIWYAGSATVGGGVPVQSNIAQRYTDHGAHVINP